MVLIRDIEVFSLCEHHMLPFLGKAHVAYLLQGWHHRTQQDSPGGGRLRPSRCRCRSASPDKSGIASRRP